MDFSAIEIEWIYVAIGFAGGVVLAGLILGLRLLRVERNNAQLTAEKTALEMATQVMDQRFKVTAQEALSKTSEDFLRLAQERLKQDHASSKHELEKRQNAIGDMVKPIEKRLEALGGAIEQVKGTDKALREDLKTLSGETARLVGALRDPAAQGKWGEYILEKLLDDSGLIKGVHYQTQVSMQTETGRQRPDVVVHLQDGFNIIVDAKAPINEMAARLGSQDISEVEYQEIMRNLARQVRSHVQALSKKSYWDNDIESPDFTVLFLPSEHLYSVALRADPALVNFAAEQNIIIASPTLLMSLLRVVGMSWRQVELAKNAQDISALGKELYERISVFSGHMAQVGKSLGQASGSYNKAISSLESRVLVSARKFENLQAVPKGKVLDVVEPLDKPIQVMRSANDTQ